MQNLSGLKAAASASAIPRIELSQKRMLSALTQKGYLSNLSPIYGRRFYRQYPLTQQRQSDTVGDSTPVRFGKIIMLGLSSFGVYQGYCFFSTWQHEDPEFVRIQMQTAEDVMYLQSLADQERYLKGPNDRKDSANPQLDTQTRERELSELRSLRADFVRALMQRGVIWNRYDSPKKDENGRWRNNSLRKRCLRHGQPAECTWTWYSGDPITDYAAPKDTKREEKPSQRSTPQASSVYSTTEPMENKSRGQDKDQ